METKTCAECGEPILGRSDKKFCSDYCRNAFNNKVNRDAKNLIRNTNNHLRKNYKILCKLNVSGKTTLPKSKLSDLQFDFNLFTSMYITKNGNSYYYVYDQGYLKLDNDFYLLIKRE